MSSAWKSPALVLRCDDQAGLLPPGREPRLEIVRQRNEPPACRFRLAARDFDVAAIPLDVLPVEPVNLGGTDSGKRPDGQKRQVPSLGGQEHPAHLVGGVD